MKRLLGILLILIMTCQLIQGQVIEQADNSQQELYDFHMLKHKKNKTAAWVLMGTGATIMVGTLISYNQRDRSGWLNDIPSESEVTMFIVGGVISLSSIPFFISAGKNKKTAILSLKGEQNIVGNIKFDNSNYLAIGITIPF